MKKFLFVVMGLCSLLSFSQDKCAFDIVQKNIEKEYPEHFKQVQAKRDAVKAMHPQQYLASKGVTYKNGQYAGPIYEIPVVVHVIESTAPSNANLAVTDAQIINWIDAANRMYATTYGGSFYPEGTGATGGTVIPFKLVLAKRKPDCTATTGIVRYNGDNISGYTNSGVAPGSGYFGASMNNVRAVAPHWPEDAYFNIYVVIGTNGNKTYNGILGWCALPYSPSSQYESVMKVAVVKTAGDTTLAHEFGHGLGLLHPFGDDTDINSTNPADACPSNVNCTTDNDEVCDTAPVMSLMTTYTPNNNAINPCTSQLYDGTQYNIMGYAIDTRKFTPGQRDKALLEFMTFRGGLTASQAGQPVDPAQSTITLTSACAPTSIQFPNNLYGVGPTYVKLNSIDNKTTSYFPGSSPFYVNYANGTSACLYKGKTDISKNTSSTLQVETELNAQYIFAWIDYNNNGVFETSERIANVTQSAPGLTTITFTPPTTNVVENVYLRMRVIADVGNNTNGCAALAYGQAEDYAVRIVNSAASTVEVDKSVGFDVVYTKESMTLTLVSTMMKNFGTYQIFDMSGKLIQDGDTTANTIDIKSKLPKGTYILSFTNEKGQFSTKFSN